jgi:uncharacterized damage-inducible protein DinB
MTPDLRFPIGPFVPPAHPEAERGATIRRLARVPSSIRLAVADLSEGQLATPYRPGGWSVRQVVHHVADSHLNFYVRLKLALTESNPTIRPYEEQLWAELADVAATPLGVSLAILDGVHERADRLLRTLTDADFHRTYVHPASGQHDVDYLLALYAWHGEHHVAHVTHLRAREGWPV